MEETAKEANESTEEEEGTKPQWIAKEVDWMDMDRVFLLFVCFTLLSYQNNFSDIG